MEKWWNEYVEELGFSKIFYNYLSFYSQIIYQVLIGNFIDYFSQQKQENDERMKWFLELGFDPFYGECKRSIIDEWNDANRDHIHEDKGWDFLFWWSLETQLQMAQTLIIILLNRWKCLTFLAFTTTFDFIYISFLLTWKIS